MDHLFLCITEVVFSIYKIALCIILLKISIIVFFDFLTVNMS